MVTLVLSLFTSEASNRCAMSSDSKTHALVIEDEMIIALEVEHLLRDLGYGSVDIASTPAQALQQAAARKPDLITADVRILGGTGIEAVRAITDRLGKIPYVYVTGNVDMLKGEDPRVVVEKPINDGAFRRACARVVRQA
jgi:CheY-like chemotaxis protein